MTFDLTQSGVVCSWVELNNLIYTLRTCSFTVILFPTSVNLCVVLIINILFGLANKGCDMGLLSTSTVARETQFTILTV